MLTREVTLRTSAPSQHLDPTEVILGNGNLQGSFNLHPSIDVDGDPTYFLVRDGRILSHGVHVPNVWHRMIRSGKRVIVNGVYASYNLADDAYAVDVKAGIG